LSIASYANVGDLVRISVLFLVRIQDQATLFVDSSRNTIGRDATADHWHTKYLIHENL